jgi:hypothetical protein
MYDLIHKFSFKETPRCLGGVKNEEDGAAPNQIKNEMSENETMKQNDNGLMQTTFSDITADIQLLSESKRNSLSVDQLFCLYLRDCSQLVHEGYYKQIV